MKNPEYKLDTEQIVDVINSVRQICNYITKQNFQI